MNNSEASSVLTVLCNHYLFPVREHSITPKKSPCPLSSCSPLSAPAFDGMPLLGISYGIRHYVTFGVWLLSLSVRLWGSSMWVLHCFSWLGNSPMYVQACVSTCSLSLLPCLTSSPHSSLRRCITWYSSWRNRPKQLGCNLQKYRGQESQGTTEGAFQSEGK